MGNIALSMVNHGSPIAAKESLASMPMSIGAWSGRTLRNLPIAEQDVLRADDYLMREYVRNGIPVALFIAYYEKQKSGDAMHSPKNCLPGAGWQPISSKVIRISVPGPGGASFDANDYVVARNGEQQEVIYWYQAAGRRYASEYLGKIYLVWNALAKDRTDGALIRLSAPHPAQGTVIHRMMVEFAEELTRQLPQFLPN
jgi:EpsI family protein